MSVLDKIAYYTSYLDVLPFLSVISSVVHLTCAIRDRVFGAPQLKDEPFFSLAERKIDNWSHLAKGFLGLVPFIGNLALAIHSIDTYFAVNYLKEMYPTINGAAFSEEDALQHLPKHIFADRTFIQAACHYNANRFSEIFKRATASIREDKQFVIGLLEEGFRPKYLDLPEPLKEDSDIVCMIASGSSLDFRKLPESLKNNLRVIKAYCFGDGDLGSRVVLQHVRHDILKNDKELRLLALSYGLLSFHDLESSQKTLEAALAALKHDRSIWPSLPSNLKEDRFLLMHLFKSVSCFFAPGRYVDEDWYKYLKEQSWFRGAGAPPSTAGASSSTRRSASSTPYVDPDIKLKMNRFKSLTKLSINDPHFDAEYKKWVRKHHPDKTSEGNKKAFEEQLKEANALKDELLRLKDAGLIPITLL